jgi:hypothetical protein
MPSFFSSACHHPVLAVPPGARIPFEIAPLVSAAPA